MCISTDSVVIENCIATDVPNGISIQQGSSGVIRNVDVSISSSSGLGLVLEMGGSVEVYDSRFEGGWCGVYSNGEVIYCVRTVFTGNDTWTLRINNSGNSVFHDCEILNGGGLTVMCNYNGSGDCHIDMTNNDWGTDSAEQIAAWIHDSNDDPEYCCTVDFVPFKGMVPTAARSWSAVKGLFSGGDGEGEH